MITQRQTMARTLLIGLLALVGIPQQATAKTTKVTTTLGATGAEPGALCKAKITIRSRARSLEGTLTLKAKKLVSQSPYEITVDGVRIGAFTTNKRGRGRGRFRTDPRPKDQLLGVDPRGRRLEIVDGAGAVVLLAAVPATGAGIATGSDIRCCLPDDSGPECEDRTPAECTALGGVDLGPGSCLPNPCESGASPPGSDIQCCLPDDSGPECEDRTTAECSAQGGINLGSGSCLPNPCSPVEPGPDDDIRCCLPDDSGPECEDRTAAECAAQGGVNIGAGTCLPNPCLGGATTTTTTLPGGGSTTTTTLPGSPIVQVVCERRSNRSKISVNGNNLATGTYRARVTSGGNTATADPLPTVGDEVEFDFDSDPGNIAAGATPIGANFIQGNPPQVMGRILDAGGDVVVQATVTCEDR